MGKKYVLGQGKTYATLKQIFRAGVTYDEAELKDVLDHTTEAGDAYFVEAGDAPAAKRTVVIGKAKKPAEGGGDGGEGGEGGEGKGPANTGPDKVIV